MTTQLGEFGARTRPLNTTLGESVLVLGLGQIGLDAVADVYEMLRQTLPPRELQLRNRLLAIAHRRSISQEQKLPREARILIEQEPLHWSVVPDRFGAHGVAKWWLRTPSNPKLQENPTTTRPFGRLLIWANAQMVGEKLFQLAEWLQTSSSNEGTDRTILVLASLAEPEGSAMLFDVVGRLRDLLYNTPTQVIGIFCVDTEQQDESERLQAMAIAYATLKELDATNLAPDSFPHELPYVGNAGKAPHGPLQRSFNHICITGDSLISNPNPAGGLAEFAMTWLLNLTQSSEESIKLLPSSVEAAIQNDTAYVSFGVAKFANPIGGKISATDLAKSNPHWRPVLSEKEQNSSNSLKISASEVIRTLLPNPSIIPNPNNLRVQQLCIKSPDPDEVVVIRMMHGWAAEHIKTLREDYRRAYYRIIADNIPLHIDRRWETTVPDLTQTTLRTEISTIWENILQALHHSPQAALPSLNMLCEMLVRSLEGDPKRIEAMPTSAEDIRLFLFNIKPFRLKVPPPQCGFVFLLAQRSSHEIADDLFQIVTNTVLEENFLFVVNIAGRQDVESIVQRLRNQGYTPLVLSETDVKHVISAPKPSSALRDIVINRIHLTAISPFYTRGPAPDHMFFGREKEIADVRSLLNTHSVVLIGGRRIGITSFIQKIMRALNAIPDRQIEPYYLDCSNVLEHRHFFRRIRRDWGIDIPIDADPIEFDEVVDELTARHEERKPVFLLDQVDRLLKTDQAENYQEPLFRTFRTLSNERQCQFLFGGEKLLMRSLGDAHSVLFNFPKEIRLGPLQREVVNRLVMEPFEMLNIGFEQSDSLLQWIYEISAGHPNIVQTICHSLVSVIDSDKSANLLRHEHLGQALDVHQLKVDIIETMWGQMHPIAKLVTIIWPKATNFVTINEIIDMIHAVGFQKVRTKQIKEWVIPDLELYNFIRQEGQGYVLIPIHFPEILDVMTDIELEIQAILEKQDEFQDGS